MVFAAALLSPSDIKEGKRRVKLLNMVGVRTPPREGTTKPQAPCLLTQTEGAPVFQIKPF